MLKDSANLIAAKVVSAHCPLIIAETETGQRFPLHLTRQQKRDPLFWATMLDILRAEIWLPITKHYHEVIDSGWLLPAQPVTAVASAEIFDYNKR